MGSVPQADWICLYKQLLRSASQFPQYNYREFFKRRIRDHFTAAVKNNDISKAEFHAQKLVKSFDDGKNSCIGICPFPEVSRTVASNSANCVENLFARNSGPCPQCGKILWKKGFWEQIFDDPVVEKENHIRKKLGKQPYLDLQFETSGFSNVARLQQLFGTN
ncbi:hypothetical protein WUBG_11930 [Wuchereria bancrofti]|uniref:Complex 1 LYR protein domain-containing protein n=1 Tax=Wuchereria bancrofti TaxID=6293 RepID=J9EPE6_WUCBA|nr:hypothetical protein WUBG_11930 [Wuchereria bancrofti]